MTVSRAIPDPVSLEFRLLNGWQRGFPLTRTPFAHIAATEGVTEADVLTAFRRLGADGFLSRIGAIVAPNVVGASTLAAMAVPPGRVEQVAALVNAEPCVNHNYERENRLNLWFVAAAPDEATLAATLARIESRSGLAVRDLRLRRPFHLDLGFSLNGPAAGKLAPSAIDASALQPGDTAILAAIEDGVPVVARPFAAVATIVDRDETEIMQRLSALLVAGIIRRFGVIVRHRALGIAANAMAVWDVADSDVERLGSAFAAEPGVTLCYARDRAFDWLYNLYCMVHARQRAQAQKTISWLNSIAGEAARSSDVLFSTRCFKQTGARFAPARRAA